MFLVAHKIRNLEILKVLIHLKELKLEKYLPTFSNIMKNDTIKDKNGDPIVVKKKDEKPN